MNQAIPFERVIPSTDREPCPLTQQHHRSIAGPPATKNVARRDDPSRDENSSESMLIKAVRKAMEQVEENIASGPIVPNVTPQEIRSYLSTRYDFNQPRGLDDLAADIDPMFRTCQL